MKVGSTPASRTSSFNMAATCLARRFGWGQSATRLILSGDG